MILLVSGNYVITNEFLFRNAVSDEIYIVCDTSSGPVNVTLPKINQEYMNGEFYISDGSSNAATNNINVLVDGTDLVNGASGIVLNTDNACCSIFVASSSDTGDGVTTPKSMWIAASSQSGGGGGSYTSNNGLNLVGTTFKLGGTLLENTTILNNGFDFVVSRNTVGGDAIKGINIDGVGVRGQSTSQAAIVGVSSSNSGVSGVSTTGQAITGTVFSTTANDIKTILRLNNSKSSPSNGIGAAIDFFVGTSSSSQVLAGKLGLLWTDVNNSTRKSKFFVSNVNNGLEENKLEVESTGQIIFNKYGINTFTGTPTYLLGVDASGNVVETRGVVSFKKTLSAANILAAGFFDISELPAVSGAYWNVESVQVDYANGGTDFDGVSKVAIFVDGAANGMYGDGTEILTSSTSIFVQLPPSYLVGSTVDCLKANAKVQVYLNNPSTAGNGTLTIYGTARLVTI